MIIEEYMRQVQALKGKIPEMAKDILTDHKDVIIGLLQQQLGKGDDKWGMPLAFSQPNEFGDEIHGGGWYAESTERYWAQQSPFPIRVKKEGSPYNFQWTGETFEMMDVVVNKDTFDIFSKTGKFEFLKQLYSPDAFELSEEHNDMINEQMLLPLLEEKLSDALADIV